jgi:hypothetical protein
MAEIMSIESDNQQPQSTNHQVYYDAENRVICVDYVAGLVLTEAIFAQVVAEIEKINQTLPHKVFVIANVNGATVDAGLQRNYEKYYSATLQHARGILRYNVTNLLTQVTIRSATVTNHLQRNQSHIYPSKAAAVEAVRLLEQMESPPA